MTHLQDSAALTAKIKEVIARDGRKLRSDLTEEQKAEALRIGGLNYSSAGAVRKR